MTDPLRHGMPARDFLRQRLDRRLGPLHARQRLGLEADHEGQVMGQGLTFFNFENWYPLHGLLKLALQALGLYWLGKRNAARVELRHNIVRSRALPSAFDGFTLLHLSDLHVEMNPEAMECVRELVAGIDYDICVLSGDFRAGTFGSCDGAIQGMARVRRCLQAPVYGVLGNHDSVWMVPALEDMGIRMLLNEAEIIRRGHDLIYLAGVDDAHFYRADNLEKAAGPIPPEAFSILLSHTPEIYRQAAHSSFNLMLSGHTHGGQICLPGGIPLTLESHLPRRLGSGAWRYQDMDGYTSVGAGSCIVPVRFNCPPEITLHRLERAAAP